MDLKLKPFDFQQAVARAGLRPDGMSFGHARAPSRAVAGAEAAGFRTAIADALRAVSGEQLEAARLQREVALDNPSVGLEETMVAMQKAQLGFQATIAVRNRLVSAYTEIMNMQV
jgi:flagellar hook-basal body complex protein FliE